MLNIGKYCFNCFKPGHIKKNCKAKVKCYCRQADGSHHIALCFSENGTPNTISSANDHSNALNNDDDHRYNQHTTHSSADESCPK